MANLTFRSFGEGFFDFDLLRLLLVYPSVKSVEELENGTGLHKVRHRDQAKHVIRA